MKVLYCILDNRFGGPHRRAHSVSLRLHEDDIETVFSTGRKAKETWHPDGFQIHSLKHIQCFYRRHPILNLLRFLLWLPLNLVRIQRLIRASGIDIVHIDGVTNFVPALAAAMSRIPIVWLYNDHLPGPLRRLLLPLVTSLSATVIVQGERLRRERTEGNARLAAKTTVLYSAVDTETFCGDRYDTAARARIRQRLGVPVDGPLIGTIGNLNRFKGHTYFLEAAARIKQEKASVKFLVVGRRLETDPDYWDQLQRLTAQLGLREDVVFAGFRDDIPAVLAALDVFVLASVLESCPVVVLEAMAMEVPVVATDVGAVDELLNHGRVGAIVPPRDGPAIAAAVLAILAQPREDVQALTRSARKRVVEEYSVDTIANRQRRIYEKLGERKCRV
jgi:glycosyltransferase involved in cell wall biosynthesis